MKILPTLATQMLIAGLTIFWLVAIPSAAEEPGKQFHVRFEDLPPPSGQRGAVNPSQVVPRPGGAELMAPEGFRVNIFLDGLTHARWLAVAQNGDVFIAEPNAGRIIVVRDSDGDGVADEGAIFIEGLSRPHGMAIHDKYFYVSTPTDIYRFPYNVGELRPSAEGERVGEPLSLGDGRGHWTRNLTLSADGRHLFVGVGSRTNISVESDPRATVQRFGVENNDQMTFASGLRNPVGIAVHPETGGLYVVVNERDNFGDDLVPDFLTLVQQGDFFGWPYAYLGPNPAPNLGKQHPEIVQETKAPDVLFQAHSAPLGLAFYNQTQFPEKYWGGAFVALHGSWNRANPTGYKVVFVPFHEGRPLGNYINFLTGFRIGETSPARVWGRPVGIALTADGSLLIADDVSQTIWRVSYEED